MHRREWMKHFTSAALAPLFLRYGFHQSAFAAQRATLSRRAKLTLASLAETMLPGGKGAPGANGMVVARLVEERLAANRAWLAFYRRGLNRLDGFARETTRRSFAMLAPSERGEVLSAFWEAAKSGQSARRKQTIDFLEIVKQDALNELFTTRAGLKWLGYKGNVHLRGSFVGCPRGDG